MNYKNFIDGQSIEANSGLTIDVLDPADGTRFATIPRGDSADIDMAAHAARRAFRGEWSRITSFDRGRILANLASLVRAELEALAGLETRDTGKTISQARRDMDLLARYLDYYAGAADKLHGETIPSMVGTTALALRVPHGVVGVITPWNYPAQMLGRCLGAALATGNTVVLKPAEDACLTSVLVGELAIRAGLPRGVLNVVCGYGRESGAALANHPLISHISFTGSTQTGTAIAEAAARRHVPVTLELGGKSPQIVFADADLDKALPVIVNSIVQNSGQTCTAGSRVLVERSVYDQVLTELANRFRTLRAGPGMSDPDCGPLINRRQRDRVLSMVESALSSDVRVAAQGELAASASAEGFYVQPTLLAGMDHSHAIAREEVFGPVQVIYPFDTEAEAIEFANATDYGLTAGVWTENGGRQMRVAHEIDAGQVFVNGYGAGGGVELPFGGMKHSGYGREKGIEGMRSFTTVKTVVLNHG